MDSSNWVDFKAVKEAVTIEQLLSHYQVNWLRKRGEELRGRCPIHQGESPDSFHVSLAKNCFQCFAGKCGKRGNVLDFVAVMESCSVRDAALKIQEWFHLSPATGNGQQKNPGQPEAKTERPSKQGVGDSGVVNKPLGFQLKNIDHSHPYLAERGISRETAEHFGVGLFSGKGSMSGRVVIPIHNQAGELVAYAGRAIDNNEPRYKLPAGFHKSAELYNLHRPLNEPTGDEAVVVVEGFFDCFKVSQAGKPCVALMGCSLSELQEKLLVRHFPAVVLLLDGDDAGRAGTEDCIRRLVGQVFVKATWLPEGKQPDMLTAGELRNLLK